MLNWEFCGTLVKVNRLEDSLFLVSNVKLQVRSIIIKYNLIKIQKSKSSKTKLKQNKTNKTIIANVTQLISGY